MANETQISFGPCSEKQRLILLDDTADILLCGGGQSLCPHVKNNP